MTFVITRTSGGKPYIETFNTIQDVIHFSEKVDEELITKLNCWYNESIENCMKYCEVSEDIAKQIVSTKYEIEIYDDYRE